jgi:hypothetical protein
VPAAATVNVAGCPTVTVALAGCAVMTGAVAGALEVPVQAESNPHSARKIETGKIAKSTFLLRLEFDELPCFQGLTQISNNRLLRLECVRWREWIEA